MYVMLKKIIPNFTRFFHNVSLRKKVSLGLFHVGLQGLATVKLASKPIAIPEAVHQHKLTQNCSQLKCPNLVPCHLIK